jgi:copper transport protein
VLAALAAEPATEHIHTDKAMAYIVMSPGRVGTVDTALTIMTGDFQKLDAKDVTVVLSNPKSGIEPFRRQLTAQGEGVWRADVDIPLPGLWRVRVDVLITDFDIVKLEGQVSIRK